MKLAVHSPLPILVQDRVATDDDCSSVSSTLTASLSSEEETKRKLLPQHHSLKQKTVSFDPAPPQIHEIAPAACTAQDVQMLWYSSAEMAEMRTRAISDVKRFFKQGGLEAARSARLLTRLYGQCCRADDPQAVSALRLKLSQAYGKLDDIVGLERLLVRPLWEQTPGQRRAILVCLQSADDPETLAQSAEHQSASSRLFGQEVAQALAAGIEFWG